MDFSLILRAVIEYWYLIPALIAVGILQSAWFKGLMGEARVNFAAKLHLDRNQYHLLTNITLPTEDGTTQIDHVIVSRYGVFVIETKNMTGWIFGSEHQPFWTQQIFRHRTRFQNPLRQNYKHVKVLESALGIDSGKIFSLVVFVGDSSFKTEMPEYVTNRDGYIQYIKSRKEHVFSDAEVRLIIQGIDQARLAKSFKTGREHTKHVKRIVDRKSLSPDCPRCGSSMVLREAKKGQNIGKQFWGCSRFPNCRGISKKSS